MTSPVLLEQRTPEWRQARAGKVTASEIDNVLSKKKGVETAGRVNYRAQILAEILTGKPFDDPFVSKPMQWGIDQEPFARAAYELLRGFLTEPAGFVEHPRIENFGCSPDGFVSDDGLVQFKCPNTATHIAYLLSGEVPEEYQPQMLVELACTGRAWCDFVSFDPRLPQDLQLFVKRFWPDQGRIQKIEQEVEKFLSEVRDTLVRLSCLGDLEGQLKKSVEMVRAKRGPQPVVSILDGKNEDEIESCGADR